LRHFKVIEVYFCHSWVIIAQVNVHISCLLHGHLGIEALVQAVATNRTALLGGFGDPHKVGLADVRLWHEVSVHGDEVYILH